MYEILFSKLSYNHEKNVSYSERINTACIIELFIQNLKNYKYNNTSISSFERTIYFNEWPWLKILKNQKYIFNKVFLNFGYSSNFQPWSLLRKRTQKNKIQNVIWWRIHMDLFLEFAKRRNVYNGPCVVYTLIGWHIKSTFISYYVFHKLL